MYTIERSISIPNKSQQILYRMIKERVDDLCNKFDMKNPNLNFSEDENTISFQSEKSIGSIKVYNNEISISAKFSNPFNMRKKIYEEQLSTWIEHTLNASYDM